MAAAASAAGFTHSATADVTPFLLEQRNHHLLFFLSFYRTHVHLADVTLIDDDMKSILTGDTKDASGATWWPNFLLMQVAPPGDQIFHQCKWRHLVAKFPTNTSGTT